MTDDQIWAYIQEHDAFTAAELSGDVSSAVACFKLGVRWASAEIQDIVHTALTRDSEDEL